MDRTIEINRGSDADFQGFWPSGPGSLVGADLTGYAIDAVFVHEALAGHLTLTITNAAAGQFVGHIEWQDDMPLGRVMQFSVRITQGQANTTLPALWVQVNA
jgi:hypothetical protein